MNSSLPKVYHFVYNYWDYSGATKQAMKLSAELNMNNLFVNSQFRKVPSQKKHKDIIDLPINKLFRCVFLFFFFVFKVKKNDICHFHGFHSLALLLATALNKKTYLKCTLEGVDDLPSLLRRKVLFVDFILKRVNKINSLNVKIDKLNRSVGLYNEKLVLIPNGVNLPEITKNNERDNFFICVGAVISRKNVLGILDYYYTHYEKLSSKLYIIGPKDISISEFEMDYYSDCKEFIVKRGMNNVEFLGVMNAIELSDYYSRALGMIFFSEKEGTPNVVLEALSYNCPVIYKSSDEVVSWVLDSELSDTLCSWKAPTPRVLKSISESGKLRMQAEKFDIKIIAQKTQELYDSL
ncbi:glycosyltransferase family 4 protein [Pseudoalteromonas sp. SG45-1]|uniref:glycosyltransferase family 4 protein n=1 Tax=Pseudoalteromonas sp. SG45-1 TaxID=2760957 RepID=UPI001600C4CD|nr:glycosyltransferase family 4 protein [Pseudoalteromonas sp. SG45-1]MBB1400966.1 glycosyltransferase family 4 protein [Pseudoalteromonas sp. SG45-1]